MTIEKIRKEINARLGERVRIVLSGSRNRVEEYDGVLAEAYPYIFILKVINSGNIESKSFSYTDILTNILEIEYRE